MQEIRIRNGKAMAIHNFGQDATPEALLEFVVNAGQTLTPVAFKAIVTLHAHIHSARKTFLPLSWLKLAALIGESDRTLREHIGPAQQKNPDLAPYLHCRRSSKFGMLWSVSLHERTEAEWATLDYAKFTRRGHVARSAGESRHAHPVDSVPQASEISNLPNPEGEFCHPIENGNRNNRKIEEEKIEEYSEAELQLLAQIRARVPGIWDHSPESLLKLHGYDKLLAHTNFWTEEQEFDRQVYHPKYFVRRLEKEELFKERQELLKDRKAKKAAYIRSRALEQQAAEQKAAEEAASRRFAQTTAELQKPKPTPKAPEPQGTESGPTPVQCDETAAERALRALFEEHDARPCFVAHERPNHVDLIYYFDESYLPLAVREGAKTIFNREVTWTFFKSTNRRCA